MEWKMAVAAALVIAAAACGQTQTMTLEGRVYGDLSGAESVAVLPYRGIVEATGNHETIEMSRGGGHQARPYDSLAFHSAQGITPSAVLDFDARLHYINRHITTTPAVYTYCTDEKGYINPCPRPRTQQEIELERLAVELEEHVKQLDSLAVRLEEQDRRLAALRRFLDGFLDGILGRVEVLEDRGWLR